MLALSDVVVAPDQWTKKDSVYSFRVWRDRLWRREEGEMFFGGYQIKYVSLHNTRLVEEWLEGEEAKQHAAFVAFYAREIELAKEGAK
jgi:hypothetical protein